MDWSGSPTTTRWRPSPATARSSSHLAGVGVLVLVDEDVGEATAELRRAPRRSGPASPPGRSGRCSRPPPACRARRGTAPGRCPPRPTPRGRAHAPAARGPRRRLLSPGHGPGGRKPPRRNRRVARAGWRLRRPGDGLRVVGRGGCGRRRPARPRSAAAAARRTVRGACSSGADRRRSCGTSTPAGSTGCARYAPPMRSRSCSAALRLKVSTRTDSGSTPRPSMTSTTASTRVVVFPVPGPASTSNGPVDVIHDRALGRVERGRLGRHGAGGDQSVVGHGRIPADPPDRSPGSRNARVRSTLPSGRSGVPSSRWCARAAARRCSGRLPSARTTRHQVTALPVVAMTRPTCRGPPRPR